MRTYFLSSAVFSIRLQSANAFFDAVHCIGVMYNNLLSNGMAQLYITL